MWGTVLWTERCLRLAGSQPPQLPATLGRRGNYPFCYHRVGELAKRGLRERIVPVASAPGEPFDFGRFDLIEEPAIASGS